MLPDMSDALVEWEQQIKLKKVSDITVDFVPAKSVCVTKIRAVVQPADKSSLKIDSLDWSKSYVLIHKRGTGINMNDFIEWDNRDFKIIGPNGDYNGYGFIEVVGEETKKDLLKATQ
jgi:hypothetical protein